MNPSLSLARRDSVCHDRSMKALGLLGLVGGALVLALAGPVSAQGPVEMKSTAPTPPKQFEIIAPGPAAREASRVPDADFYREDQRVPYAPALVEPFVGKTKGGSTYGLSAWTSPETPVGSLASQAYHQNNGWFGFGITFIWDSGPPAVRPSSPPR
jgi:hypothetical protein